jgi:hypothetical protein
VGRLNRITGISDTVQDHDAKKKKQEINDKYPDKIGPYMVRIIRRHDSTTILFNDHPDSNPSNELVRKLFITINQDGSFEFQAFGKQMESAWRVSNVPMHKKEIHDFLHTLQFKNVDEMVNDMIELMKELEKTPTKNKREATKIRISGSKAIIPIGGGYVERFETSLTGNNNVIFVPMKEGVKIQTIFVRLGSIEIRGGYGRTYYSKEYSIAKESDKNMLKKTLASSFSISYQKSEKLIDGLLEAKSKIVGASIVKAFVHDSEENP